jgi:hypothetical protein
MRKWSVGSGGLVRFRGLLSIGSLVSAAYSIALGAPLQAPGRMRVVPVNSLLQKLFSLLFV